MIREIPTDVIQEKHPYFRTIQAKATEHTYDLLYQPELCLTPDEVTISQAMLASNLSNKEGFRKVVELGVGSGVFLSYMLLDSNSHEFHVRGIDIDPNALKIARYNLEGVANLKGLPSSSYSLSTGDWLRYEEIDQQGTDLIYANPPYLPTGTPVREEFSLNPHHALFAGNNGLSHYETIIHQSRAHLRPGGYLFLRTSNKPELISPVRELIDRFMPHSEVEFVEQRTANRRGTAFLVKYLPTES